MSIVFIRDVRGHGELFLHSTFYADVLADRALTPPSLNVYEAFILSPAIYAYAASNRGEPPQIYLTDATHANAPLRLGESRYPTLSPDGA